uniref:ATP-binding cassette sub-family C member 10 isoform X2 n=1 Tax=Doryrhamphus excisus TaxID=161450 RepID=UPI0025ADFDF5|nr:ATP-binding cassette sub-family C member 10 isoform X2 [Doryrhamphus excisus]
MGGFWPTELVSELCHGDEGNPFPVWQDGHVGICFNQLLLGVLPHVVMATLSAFYFGRAKSAPPLTVVSGGWTLRLVSTLLTALLFAADVIVVGTARQTDMYLDVLASSSSALAWLVHAGAIVTLRRTAAFRRTHGPSLLPLSVLLCVPNMVVTLMFYLAKKEDYLTPSKPFHFTRFVLACTRMLPIFLYLLGVACPFIRETAYALHIQDVDRSPLIAEDSELDTGEMVAEEGSSCVSRLFYLWLTPLFRRGRRGELERPSDVYHLPRSLRTSVIRRHFHQSWAACRRGAAVRAVQDQWPRPIQNSSGGHYKEEPLELEGDVSLLRVLHTAFGARFYVLGLLKLMVNLLRLSGPLLLNILVSFMEEEDAPASRGAWCAAALFASTLLCSFLQNMLGFRISKVGVAFLGGLGVTLLLVPFNKFLASRILSNNQDMLRYKDSRVKLMTEILFGIRVIKFYSWEAHFTQKVSECRQGELTHLKAIKYLDAMCVYTWAALPVVISILTFVTYVLLGHQLSAAKVFTTLALVGMLIIPINTFPWVFNCILEAKVSLQRIQRFFKLTNQDLQVYYALVTPEDDHTVVLLSQGTFSWQQDTEEHSRSSGSLLLHNLNLQIRKGSLTVVVGKVGCGKSSLLAALTGELIRHSGVVYVAGRESGFGLASQEPWIQHASVRDNILFGKEHDASFYQAVIEACALSDDLSILPDGDRTEVGENGITLSGGQKARLALARAVYMDKDIYFLDDPLAAVDAHVAQHLMHKCIMELLAGKTRILCTHRIELVDQADMVVLMDNGTIIKTGSPTEILPLIEASPKLHKNEQNAKENESEEEEEEEQVSSINLCVDDADDAELSGAEKKQAGSLAWKVYGTYWAAVGGALATSILLSLLAMQASKNMSDWWLSHWISELKNTSGVNNSSWGVLTAPHLLLFSSGGLMSSLSLPQASSANLSSEVRFYLTVYGCFATANTVFTAIRAFLFAYGTICAATVIHKRLLNRVLKATMTFFDTTPLGRILNRFSSDLYSVDDSLPFILNILLANVFNLLGMLVMMSYGLPWLLLALPPLALMYYRTQRFYRHTSRELKRLCSVTLSPVYSHFSETVSGLGTIRASRSCARFEEESLQRLEQNQRCLFLSKAAMQWLDIRLQLIGVAVVTSLSIIAVIQHQFHAVEPGLVGLSLSYALSITTLLSGLIFSFTQTEMQLVSVERAEEYSSELPMEPQPENPQLVPLWPELGRVEFRHVVLVYREGLPNAVDGVSLLVRPGEKVGIVGRTGSGKSTLFLALFRMMEVSQGQILLDGRDVSSVDVAQLRSRLAIIPQDPFLFSGTIRENLDPCGKHQDQQLLEVLDQCHLMTVVSRMGGLDAQVEDRGKSFSVGQRQLLCLSRALLTQAKVLCVDEATASVDQKTDKLLQKTIRERFQDKTVLTIAHRLNTIMDCERVLVMHAGKVVDFDTPAALCQKEDSIFGRLLSEVTK